VNLEFFAGIVDMEIDRALGQPQDNPHFPAGFADGRPMQAS
jgi:hypothetical protein